jgi:hypothetical protein
MRTDTYGACCTACAAQPVCKAWDWNPDGKACYLKDNADGVTKVDRWSGVMPKSLRSSSVKAATTAAPHPALADPPGPPAPQSQTKYNDAAWEVVDAPHDMLINQHFSPNNSKGMA